MVNRTSRVSAGREDDEGQGTLYDRSPEWLRNWKSPQPLQVGVPVGLSTEGLVESLPKEPFDPIAYLSFPSWQQARYLLSDEVESGRLLTPKYRHRWEEG